MADLHRLDLEEFDAERYPAGWVDLHSSRTWKARLAIQDAATEAVSRYKLALLEHSIARWSFDDPPSPVAFERLDEFLGEWLYQQITDWYVSRRRAPEASKSAALAAGDGAGEGAGAD